MPSNVNMQERDSPAQSVNVEWVFTPVPQVVSQLYVPHNDPTLMDVPITSSAQHITLVQKSFAQIAPHADLVTDLFFARLFQLEPARRAPLPNDLRALKGQFMYALARAVRDLNPSRENGELQTTQDTQILTAALLWTLEQGLGEEFTAPVREAWTLLCPQLIPALAIRQSAVQL